MRHTARSPTRKTLLERNGAPAQCSLDLLRAWMNWSFTLHCSSKNELKFFDEHVVKIWLGSCGPRAPPAYGGWSFPFPLCNLSKNELKFFEPHGVNPQDAIFNYLHIFSH